MKKIIKISNLILVTLLILQQISQSQNVVEANVRTWTSVKKTTIEGVLTGIVGDEVSIKRSDGNTIKLKISMLSLIDQNYIKSLHQDKRSLQAVAFIGSVDDYHALYLENFSMLSGTGRKIEVEKYGIHNVTNSKEWEKGNITLKYNHKELEEFASRYSGKADMHFVVFVSHSILVHPKLGNQYIKEVEKYSSLAKKHKINFYLFDTGPLAENHIVRNFDNLRRNGREANEAVKSYLDQIKDWKIISLPKVRGSCAEKFQNKTLNFSWDGFIPTYLMNSVIYSAILQEQAPLVKYKQDILSKQGIVDPVVANPVSNKGEISHEIITTSNENLESISKLINEVVHQE